MQKLNRKNKKMCAIFRKENPATIGWFETRTTSVCCST